MANLDFSLDDIKPLLSAVGLGQDPTPAPKPVNTQPPPPLQLPPTPAAAGFSEWAGDPQNLSKVATGMTTPGQPILPPPPALGANVPLPPNLPSVAPPQQPSPAFLNPPMPTSAPTPAQAQQTNMNLDMAANPSQYQKPGLVGQGLKGALLFGIPAALQSLGSGLNRQSPTAGMDFINQQVARDRGVPAANAAEYDLRNVKPLQDAAKLADTQSQTAQRNADADKKSTQADDMQPFQLSPAQAAAINQPALAGTTATMRDYNRLLGLAGNNNTSQANNQNTNATKVTTNAATNDTRVANNAATNSTRTAISDAANKTKTLLQGMRDSTSRANNENTNANKGKAGEGSFKVPADVTKRAALASNVLENADAVDGIITKRPDIIGAAGGRYSNVQQMIGSNDPDIQALGVRMHNIALASNGAHGVRAQQAIQKTEDELFSNFKAGPDAIKGALGATRGSMQTFLNDEQNFSSSGKRTGITPPPTGGAPKEGDTKVNSAGDKVSFKGGKWGPA